LSLLPFVAPVADLSLPPGVVPEVLPAGLPVPLVLVLVLPALVLPALVLPAPVGRDALPVLVPPLLVPSLPEVVDAPEPALLLPLELLELLAEVAPLVDGVGNETEVDDFCSLQPATTTAIQAASRPGTSKAQRGSKAELVSVIT
jgi:hypothetical protein